MKITIDKSIRVFGKPYMPVEEVEKPVSNYTVHGYLYHLAHKDKWWTVIVLIDKRDPTRCYCVVNQGSLSSSAYFDAQNIVSAGWSLGLPIDIEDITRDVEEQINNYGTGFAGVLQKIFNKGK